MMILQGIRYFIIGLVPLLIIILSMHVIRYAYEVAPNLLQVVFNIFVGIFLIAVIIAFGIIVDEDCLQKWR